MISDGDKDDARLSLLFELSLAAAAGILVFDYLVHRFLPGFGTMCLAPFAVLLALVATLAARCLPRGSGGHEGKDRRSVSRDRSGDTSSL